MIKEKARVVFYTALLFKTCYPCTLVSRFCIWSTEPEERSSGRPRRLSHSDVSFCSWSNTSMDMPATVAISSGCVSISSVSTCWKCLSFSDHHAILIAKLTQPVHARTHTRAHTHTPGWLFEVWSRTQCCWTCRTWPLCRRGGWATSCSPWAALCRRSTFSTGAMTPTFPPRPPNQQSPKMTSTNNKL